MFYLYYPSTFAKDSIIKSKVKVILVVLVILIDDVV